jgi:hypothetical protein
MPKMTTVAAVPPDPEETALQRFERELHERYPTREVRRYAMPSNVRECLAVYFVEVTSRDEITASIYADSVMSHIEKASVKLSAEACRRETMRASIVGIATRDKPARYRHIDNEKVPFHELDDWSAKATAALLTYFNELNGIRSAELIEGLMGARTVGITASPMSEIPASEQVEK